MEFVKDIRPASDRSLHVSFGGEISMESYGSVLVDFDPRLRTHEQIEALVRECLGLPDTAREEEARTVEIPVRYGGEFGPDLEDVSRHTGLAAERVVELFAAAEYLVYFVGFSTCFPYLGGLPPELATPRLSAPRKHMAAGSVAIGGSQAGIYPLASPGGWRIVGRTPLRLFDPQASPPPLLRMGDRVRFIPVPTMQEAFCGPGGAGGSACPPVSSHIRVLSPGLQ